MAFIESPRFPEGISFGARGGPRFKTSTVQTTSGFESRNIDWSQAQHEWDVAHGIKNEADFKALKAFFMAMFGQAHSWRFKDWFDFKADMASPPTAVQFGVGDGSANFQLTKTYAVGSQTYVRDIKKPVSGTISILVNDVLKTEGVNYTIAYTTGIVSFTPAPGMGETLKWLGEFDVPCRFAEDFMEAEYEAHEAINWSLRVKEIRL